MAPWNRRFLLETIIFRFHVKLAGSSPLFCLWGCKTPYGRYSMFQARINLWWKNGCFSEVGETEPAMRPMMGILQKTSIPTKNGIPGDWTCMKHRSCLPKMSILFRLPTPNHLAKHLLLNIQKPRENIGTIFQYERARCCEDPVYNRSLEVYQGDGWTDDLPPKKKVVFLQNWKYFNEWLIGGLGPCGLDSWGYAGDCYLRIPNHHICH